VGRVLKAEDGKFRIQSSKLEIQNPKSKIQNLPALEGV
jgi:hypothetical protein